MNINNTEKNYNDAKTIFDYLYMNETGFVHADLIVGFGHFDQNIARRCAALYEKGYSEKILFNGGRGAGSADLDKPEAVAFLETVKNEYPQVSEQYIIIESESTNTGENITMSAKVMHKADSNFNLENGVKSVIAVASPYRQRRVYLALRKLLPNIKVYNMPPISSFGKEKYKFEQKGEDFLKLLLGEIERIRDYPEKGFIMHEEIPKSVLTSYNRIKK